MAIGARLGGAARGGGKFLAGAAGVGAVAGMRQLASAVPGGPTAVTGLAGLAAATFSGARGGGAGGAGRGGAGGKDGGIKALLLGQQNIVKVLSQIHKDTSSIRTAVEDMRKLAYEDARARLKEIKKPKIAGLLAGGVSNKVTPAEGVAGIPNWMVAGLAGLAAMKLLMAALGGAAGWLGAALIAKPWKALKGFFGAGGTLSKWARNVGRWGARMAGWVGTQFKSFFGEKGTLSRWARNVGRWGARMAGSVGTAFRNFFGANGTLSNWGKDLIRWGGKTGSAIKTKFLNFFGAKGTLAGWGSSLKDLTGKGIAGIQNFFLGEQGRGGRTGGLLQRVGNSLKGLTSTGLAGIQNFFLGEQGRGGRTGGLLQRIGSSLTRAGGFITKPLTAIATFFQGAEGKGGILTRIGNTLGSIKATGLDKIKAFFSAGGPIARAAAALGGLVDDALRAVGLKSGPTAKYDKGKWTKLVAADDAKTQARKPWKFDADKQQARRLADQRAARAANVRAGFEAKRDYGGKQTPVRAAPKPAAIRAFSRNFSSSAFKGTSIASGIAPKPVSGTKGALKGGMAAFGKASRAMGAFASPAAKGVIAGVKGLTNAIAKGLAFFFAKPIGRAFLKAFKIIMKVVPVLGVVLVGYEAIMILSDEEKSDEDKTNELGELIGKTVGAIAGIKIGAMLGTLAGPLGTLAGMLIGGVAFYFGGGWLGRKIARIIMGYTDGLTKEEKKTAEELIAGQEESLELGNIGMRNWKGVVKALGANKAVASFAQTSIVTQMNQGDRTQKEAVEMVEQRIGYQQRVTDIAQAIAAREGGTLPGTQMGEAEIAAAGQPQAFMGSQFQTIRRQIHTFANDRRNTEVGGTGVFMTQQEAHDYQVAAMLKNASDPTADAEDRKFATTWLKKNAGLDAQGRSIAPITNQNGAGGAAAVVNGDATTTAAANADPGRYRAETPHFTNAPTTINNVDSGSQLSPAFAQIQNFWAKKDQAIYQPVGP